METQERAQRVILIVCGIAGPALGMFLARAGIRSVICEARQGAADREGAFLGVAPNGMNVLAELGVDTAVEAVAAPCHAFEFRNAADRRIGVIDRTEDGARFGARLQMVRRAELHEVLVEAAIARGIEVRFGRELVAIDAGDPDVISARFSDGSVERGAALIGCDGLRSRTRELALPDAPAPSYAGLLDLAGFARCPPAPLEVGVNVMVFGRRAFFGAFKTGAGEVWWFHNGGAERSDGLARHPDAMRAWLVDLHREDPPWIREVIASTDTLLGPYGLHDILSMPRWHVGRVCLIGDAAHAATPSAGQGASMALEDAMVLAQCLRDGPSPSLAFAAFERARRARVEEIVKHSRRSGSGKAVAGPVSAWFRDRMIGAFLRLGARTQDRHYAHRIAWSPPVSAERSAP
jgi:2-polyprenyl-6-methoxyphenol hydroxylase-like FAD-dependent oxidoreductase